MAVKGSKFKPMRITAHDPVASITRWLSLVMVFVICLSAAYFLGSYITRESYLSKENKADTQQEHAKDELLQQVARLRLSAEVDRQSMEELRQLVVTQKAQLSASERDLKVYKDLLSPNAKVNPLGISFGVFTVFPLKESNHFSYSLTVQKLSTKETDFAGSLEFRIIGLQGEKNLQLSLYQVSSQVISPSIPLGFKYFQTLEGDMTLPVDFKPQSVELVIKSSGKKVPPVMAAELDWPASTLNSNRGI